MTLDRPGPDEFAPYYAQYLARVPKGADVLRLLAEQHASLPQSFIGVSPEACRPYAPGKWSAAEVLGHLGDTERVFAYRMLRVLRGDATPLPGFDENAYVVESDFEARGLDSVVGEWATVRRATLTLADGVAPERWTHRGEANGGPFSARALLYILAGHTEHHLAVLAERYDLGAGASPAG